MKSLRMSKSFNGTGAAVYLCLGFIPAEVEIRGTEDSELARVFWSRNSRAAESNNGFIEHGGDQTTTLYTAGQGVEPYYGQDVMDSVLQTSVGYGEGVYLYQDPVDDYKANTTYGFQAEVSTWTLDTSGSRTGHFNADSVASGGRCGEGSLVMIKETSSGIIKTVVIEAMTAGQGIDTDEVTLSEDVADGQVLRITGMYDLLPVPIGNTTPAGVKLNATTDINVNDEIQEIIAIQREE